MADTLLVRCGKAGGGKGALVQHELSATLSTSNVQTLFTDGGGHGRHCGGDWMDPRLTVRRLTPLETERLQGFPDGHTDIPYKGKDHPPDGLRYKATGNSMAVPVMAWIADGIVDVEFGTHDRRVHPWRPPTVDDVEPLVPGPLVWVDPANGGGQDGRVMCQADTQTNAGRMTELAPTLTSHNMKSQPFVYKE